MTDDLKLPQVGELTLPRWQYWLARYNEVLGERERRIEKLEAALREIETLELDPRNSGQMWVETLKEVARKALEGKDG